jgi:hypothetical protein
MRKLLFLMSLMVVTGCQSIVGPFEPRLERADDPLLTPAEQTRRTRYLYAFPDEELAPRSAGELPEPLPPDR